MALALCRVMNELGGIMRHAAKLADRYLEAWDESMNSGRGPLKLESYATVQGWSALELSSVRTYLEKKGIL